jgi:2-methylcitrate dehydratase PrpD
MSFVPARIRIITHAGQSYAHTVQALKGSPELPMSWQDVVEERLSRALRYSAQPLTDRTVDELQRTVAALEDVPDATVLVDLLSGGNGIRKPSGVAGSKIRRQSEPQRAASDAIAALAEHVAAIEYDDIDGAAREATKRLLLDAIATTIAGASAPGCESVVGLLRDWGGKAESSIVLHGGRVPSHHAVIANVMMCHALELDDLFDPAITHATAPAFWSGMATAEALGQGTSGRDLLTAVAVGADVMCRIAAAAPRTFTLGHHNALLAGFAAVATAGKLRRVGADVLRDAFGIAFCQAAASVQALPDGTLVKRLQPALNACDGLRSLALAENGITGVQAVLEGKFGFCRLFGHDACDRDALLADLGRRFLGAESSIKRYPSSRCTHAPVEAVLHLVRQHQLTAEDVAAVKVKVSGPCVRVAGAPFAETAGAVQVDAQFNIAYTVAAALLWRDVFIPQITEPLVLDPRARELAARVTVDVLPEAAEHMSFVPAEVAIQLTSGQELTHRLERLKGSPQNPMSWDDITAERLERCLAYAPRPIAAAKVDRLVGLVKRLEESADVCEIIALLA